MGKRSENNENLNGLPTAILYLSMFGCAGCLGLFLFVLVTGGFFWGWMRFCDWSGLAAAILARGWRFLLGALLYLIIGIPICAKFWQEANRPSAQQDAKENEATMTQLEAEKPSAADTGARVAMADPYELKPINTLLALANMGFGLADGLEQEGKRIYFKDDRSWQLVMEADDLRAEAQAVADLSNDPVVRERLESSPLLSQTTRYPAAAPDAEWLHQFALLHAMVLDFAHATVSWETYFAANQQHIEGIWAAPRLWTQAYQEQQQRTVTAIRQHRAEKLAEAQARFGKPVRAAPCFAERRKNGLQCNRGDLVQIEQLPTVAAPPQRIEVSIKRCSQCWQMYKEYFVSGDATRQARSHFLKPGETDVEHEFHFSSAEAEAAAKINFSALLNPDLPPPAAPGSS